MPGVEANSLLPADAPEASSWWTTVEKLVENDYNLSAGRYKPQRQEAVSDEDPKDLIRKTIALENELAANLKDLLNKVEAVE